MLWVRLPPEPLTSFEVGSRNGEVGTENPVALGVFRSHIPIPTSHLFQGAVYANWQSGLLEGQVCPGSIPGVSTRLLEGRLDIGLATPRC